MLLGYTWPEEDFPHEDGTQIQMDENNSFLDVFIALDPPVSLCSDTTTRLQARYCYSNVLACETKQGHIVHTYTSYFNEIFVLISYRMKIRDNFGRYSHYKMLFVSKLLPHYCLIVSIFSFPLRRTTGCWTGPLTLRSSAEMQLEGGSVSSPWWWAVRADWSWLPGFSGHFLFQRKYYRMSLEGVSCLF